MNRLGNFKRGLNTWTLFHNNGSKNIHHNNQHRHSLEKSIINHGKKNMCGLVAAIDDIWTTSTSSNSPLLHDKTYLSKTTDILYHRGPDGMMVDMGKFTSSSHSKHNYDARWSMGHTRLAIVDPSNRFADMPFKFHFQTIDPKTGEKREKRLHLAANGEIYNHSKLYDSLVQSGWNHDRFSGSDCEVIGHAYAHLGGVKAVSSLDGMFAFVLFEEDLSTGEVKCIAARDPVGIKPLYYGRTKDGNAYAFASELKALVGSVDPSSVVAVPPGHYWTPEDGLVRYHNPQWLHDEEYKPWAASSEERKDVTDEDVRQAFTAAVQKRMMADVEYGFFLSGGVDSCVVAHDLLPLYRKERIKTHGDDRPIPTFTVGMENSPDVMAARAMVDALGGEKHVEHNLRTFTPDEVFDLIPKIVFHMETYEAELIRSAIPNWLLAERAAQDVKMVLTGEGADELFAGYLYFKDAETPNQVQNELKRIYSMLGNINLHRTDRMTMAHGLEARVPFLDTEFTRLAMSVDPQLKMVNADAVRTNSRGREKTYMREIFEGPNSDGNSIPRPVLWRAKAMQCEGVGEDWVSILQRRIASLVSDAEMDEAHITYPINTPHTKEELYYRKIYDEHFHGMEHVVKLWEGGGRAMGAAWKSDMYTREGLKNTNLLSHSLQQQRGLHTNTNTTTKNSSSSTTTHENNHYHTNSHHTHPHKRTFSTMSSSTLQDEPPLPIQAHTEARDMAVQNGGFNQFESWLTAGCDDRSLILESGTNKYHIQPQPVHPQHVFRGSCTGNPPTQRGYDAAQSLYESTFLPILNDEAQLDSKLRDIFETQRQRIAKCLDLPEGCEVILCPSGSDAEYIPVAIASALTQSSSPPKHIVNGVTQLKEIGAGSAPASFGEYFSTHAPFVGKLDESNTTGRLAGMDHVSGEAFDARQRSGNVVDAVSEIESFQSKAFQNNQYPILHGVFGGKTGLRDTTMPSSIDQGDTSLAIVDACQGRFTKDELHSWLNDNHSIVLFTASKFYQAPPFCAAVILPPSIAQKVQTAQAPNIDSPCGARRASNMFTLQGLGGFITDKELPSCMNHWKDLQNPSANNVGLALRWEAGLAGMEALQQAVPHDTSRETKVTEWANSVTDLIGSQYDHVLDAWCVERSIVSIRIKKGSLNDDPSAPWLNMKEARDLYRWMSMDVSDLVPHASDEEKLALSKPAFIGQPVDVSEGHAIVRIALGVESLISYVHDKDATLDEDRRTVEKLAAIGKYFDTLQQSGK
eukprot:CAMPEP_0184858214 /NCGR_PEP_ID=MMETSP0580-20130426/3337_1 /TAXON_ID=1118495 /ORGANISM="Dactyliosolen fragilissimus" /LENGTH=1253 /DNA_ID=CAMNT_0027354245 /DNA_START=181 /DNA_END=3942 /DNA_ORIENTATION=+